MSSERGGKVFASGAVPKGAKSFPEEPLDTEWRHAKLRRMRGQPGRRPVQIGLGRAAALSGCAARQLVALRNLADVWASWRLDISLGNPGLSGAMGSHMRPLWVVSMLKGGSRKSTTAMFLAFGLASRRHDVLMIDADHGTQGVTDWATRVYAEGGGLPFHVAQWTPRLGLLVPFIQQQARETSATRVLVDVGGEAPEVLRQVVMTATMVITPVGPEQGELARLPATAAIVRPTGISQAVLLTRVPAEGRGAARDARLDLADAGYDVLQTEIPQNRKMYADVWGMVPYSLGAYEALTDELLEREK